MSSTKKTSLVFLAILIMMSMSALIATDIFLPAMVDMIHYYSLNTVQAQSLISVYLFGIAVMQLVYGPVSDSFGRKTILIIGITLFIVSSVAMTFFNSYHAILLMRLIQALGACVGFTLGRAIVGDLYDKKEAGKIFLTIFPFVGVSPALAPVIGGWLNSTFNWQACFYFTAIFAFILLILVIFFLDESRPKEKRTAIHIKAIAYNYYAVIKNPLFWGYTLSTCFAYAAYLSYIAESPFLLLQQGLTSKTIGYSFIVLSFGYITGNLTARQVMRKFSLDNSLMIGYIIAFVGGLLFFTALFNFPTVFAFSVSTMCIITFGNGFIVPLATAGGITVNPNLTGSTAGIMGCLQLASGAIAAQAIGLLSQHIPFRIGFIMLTILAIGLLIQIVFYFNHKKVILKYSS